MTAKSEEAAIGMQLEAHHAAIKKAINDAYREGQEDMQRAACHVANLQGNYDLNSGNEDEANAVFAVENKIHKLEIKDKTP